MAKCDEVIARKEARLAMRWPAAFVYVGETGRAEIGGRLLKNGDVCLLSEGQATAFADRFERVIEEEVTS